MHSLQVMGEQGAGELGMHWVREHTGVPSKLYVCWATSYPQVIRFRLVVNSIS